MDTQLYGTLLPMIQVDRHHLAILIIIIIVLILKIIYAYRQCTRNCANKGVNQKKNNIFILGGWPGS